MHFNILPACVCGYIFVCAPVHVNEGGEAAGNHVRWPVQFHSRSPGEDVEKRVFSTVGPSAPMSSLSSHPLATDDSCTTAIFIFLTKTDSDQENQWNKESFPRPAEEADVIKSVCRVREIKEREACEVQGKSLEV